MPRASSTAPGSAATASAGDGLSGTPGVNPAQGRTAHGGPFLGIRACIWPAGTPNPPAIAWSPPGPCLQRGPCALHRARDIGRGLGSSQTLHRLRLPPCPAATGQRICLSQNYIPVVVRERVGAGWAGTSTPIVAGSRTEDLFIFEQDGARRERSITTVHVLLLIQSPRAAPLRLLLLESSWGLRTPLKPLSAWPGDLRLRNKE